RTRRASPANPLREPFWKKNDRAGKLVNNNRPAEYWKSRATFCNRDCFLFQADKRRWTKSAGLPFSFNQLIRWMLFHQFLNRSPLRKPSVQRTGKFLFFSRLAWRFLQLPPLPFSK